MRDGSSEPGRIRWLAGAAAVWLCVVTVRYLWTVLQAITNPPNEGADLFWAAVLLAVAGAIAFTHHHRPTIRTTNLWLIALACPAISMIVLSGHLRSALAAGWVLALGWMLGNWFLRRAGIRQAESALEWAVVAVPLGLTAIAFVPLVLGAVSRLTPGWIGAALAMLTAAALPSARQGIRDMRQGTRRAAREDAAGAGEPLLALLGLVVLISLVWTVAPEVQFDALNYHLAVPRMYLDAGRLIDLPYFWHSYFAQMIEMLFAVMLALDGPVAAKALGLAVTVLAAGGTSVLGTLLFSRRVGLWAAALFLATPLVGRLSTTADVDLWVALMLVALWIALLRWKESNGRGWLWVMGVLAGGAVGARVTAVFGLPWVGAAILRRLTRRADRRPRLRVVEAAGVAAAGAIVAVPWYLPRLVFTGNPFFPFFDDRHPSVGGAARNIPSDISPEALAAVDPLNLQWIWDEILRIPWRFVFATDAHGGHLAGVCGTGLLFIVPFGMFLLPRNTDRARSVLGIGLVYLILWFAAFPHARLFLPVLPVVLVLGLGAILVGPASAWRRYAATALVGTTMAAQLALLPTQFWHVPERLPMRRAFGLESEDDFLSRSLPEYDAARFVNRATRPGDRIVGVSMSGVRYYLQPPLASWDETWDLQGVRAPIDERTADALHRKGYRLLALNHREAPSRQIEQDDAFRKEEYLDRYTTPLYSRGGVTVYRMERRPVGPRPFANLLDNPGFEVLDSAGLPSDWTRYGRPTVQRDAGRGGSGELVVGATPVDGLVQRVRAGARGMYRLSHVTRSDAPGQHARLQINWLDGRDNLIEAAIHVVPATGDWQRHRMLATSPDGAAAADVYVSVHADSRVWFDDFELVRVDDRAVASGVSPRRADP